MPGALGFIASVAGLVVKVGLSGLMRLDADCHSLAPSPWNAGLCVARRRVPSHCPVPSEFPPSPKNESRPVWNPAQKRRCRISPVALPCYNTLKTYWCPVSCYQILKKLRWRLCSTCGLHIRRTFMTFATSFETSKPQCFSVPCDWEVVAFPLKPPFSRGSSVSWETFFSVLIFHWLHHFPSGKYLLADSLYARKG